MPNSRPHSQFDAYLCLHRASSAEWRAALQRLQLAEHVVFGTLRQPTPVGSLSTLDHARGRVTLVLPTTAHTLIQQRHNTTPLIVLQRESRSALERHGDQHHPPLEEHHRHDQQRTASFAMHFIPANTAFELDFHPEQEYWLLQSHQPSSSLFLTEQQQYRIRHDFAAFLAQHTFSKDHDHSMRLIGQLFQQITGHLYAPYQATQIASTKPLDNRIKKALHKIEHDREWSFDLAELASLAGVSERNLYYLMKTHIGMTPYVYYQRIRLLRVRQRLVDCQCDVPHVSWYAGHEGFSHLGRFAAIFRKHFGELPSETIQWRRSLEASRNNDVAFNNEEKDLPPSVMVAPTNAAETA